MRFSYLSILAISLFSLSVMAQSTANFQPYWRGYFSLGAGLSFTQNINENIYEDGHSNVQLGFLMERSFHRRWSVLSGVEFEQITYSLDGAFSLNEQELELVPADAGRKYNRLYNRNFAFPLQVRYYFADNRHKDKAGMYLQGGARLAYAWNASYQYRQNDESQNINLSDALQRFIVGAELMLGFKGNYFSSLDLLNASTLGVIYQASPVFEGSTSFSPLHFTWRFLF